MNAHAVGGGAVASQAPGLYVHVPFCSAVCPYCDFAVLVGKSRDRSGYVDLLLAEADLIAAEAAQRERTPSGFDTLYLGGGTPTALGDEELARLIRGLKARFVFKEELWIALEANPEDVTPQRVAAWRELSVEFLSLGVQSLHAPSLRFLGRRHTPEDARAAVELAMAAEFSCVSVDLIYSLPGEEPASWQSMVSDLVSLGPQHISAYELTFHEETPFGRAVERGQIEPPQDNERAERFLETHRVLATHGYLGYELSNFALGSEFRSRHNRKYWNHTPYLGLGPSAHSFDTRRRFWNQREFSAWRASVEAGEVPRAAMEELTSAQLALETLMLRLRTVEGVDLEEFEARFAVDLLELARRPIERAAAMDWIAVEGGALRPTLGGRAVSESLALSLFRAVEDALVSSEPSRLREGT